jgi:hypothetical protein
VILSQRPLLAQSGHREDGGYFIPKRALVRRKWPNYRAFWAFEQLASCRSYSTVCTRVHVAGNWNEAPQRSFHGGS